MNVPCMSIYWNKYGLQKYSFSKNNVQNVNKKDQLDCAVVANDDSGSSFEMRVVEYCSRMCGVQVDWHLIGVNDDSPFLP
jgi:formylmethanofuran dehydrogenase subunit B